MGNMKWTLEKWSNDKSFNKPFQEVVKSNYRVVNDRHKQLLLLIRETLNPFYNLFFRLRIVKSKYVNTKQ